MRSLRTEVRLPHQAVLGMKALLLLPKISCIFMIFLSALFMNCIDVGDFSYFYSFKKEENFEKMNLVISCSNQFDER